MRKQLFFLWLLAAGVVSSAVAEYGTRLQDGTPIVIDDTARTVYTLQGGSVRRPLWDGVYRLENGATLTVSNGVLINELGPDVRSESPAGAASRCESLVKQTCGADNHCATAPGCVAARQLSRMEEQEHQSDHPSASAPSTVNACAEALNDRAYFAPCTPNASDSASSTSGAPNP